MLKNPIYHNHILNRSAILFLLLLMKIVFLFQRNNFFPSYPKGKINSQYWIKNLFPNIFVSAVYTVGTEEFPFHKALEKLPKYLVVFSKLHSSLGKNIITSELFWLGLASCIHNMALPLHTLISQFSELTSSQLCYSYLWLQSTTLFYFSKM